MKVSEVMHAPAAWVEVDTAVRDVALRMAEMDIGAIPLGRKDRLVGMLSLGDVAHGTGLYLAGGLARAVAGHHR